MILYIVISIYLLVIAIVVYIESKRWKESYLKEELEFAIQLYQKACNFDDYNELVRYLELNHMTLGLCRFCGNHDLDDLWKVITSKPRYDDGVILYENPYYWDCPRKFFHCSNNPTNIQKNTLLPRLNSQLD